MGALVLACAVVCAAATLAAALALATPSHGETVMAATGPEPAARAASGAQGTGVWDPALQGFRDPTADELAVMSRGSLPARGEMVRVGKPQVERRPDGSMLLRVGERGFGATWSHVESDGTVESYCRHSGADHEAPAPPPAAAKEEE